MTTPLKGPNPEVDERLWNTWIKRGKANDLRSAANARLFGAVAVLIVAAVVLLLNRA